MFEALKYDVTTLELDVVVSRNLEVVVSHEPWMEQEICLDPKGQVIEGRTFNLYKLTHDEMKAFDCGSKPHPRFAQQKKVKEAKPLLAELLKAVEDKLAQEKRPLVSYNIEIKSTPEDEKSGFQPAVKTFADVVVKTIRGKLPDNRFTIQSFDWRVLKYLHKAYPEIRLVALFEGRMTMQQLEKKLGFRPMVFSPYFKHVDASLVKSYQASGIKVIPWTVNDVTDMVAMLRQGVDGIITDYPDRMAAALKAFASPSQAELQTR